MHIDEEKCVIFHRQLDIVTRICYNKTNKDAVVRGETIKMHIAEYEERMWQAALTRNKAAFSEIVRADAVMVCGGFRCTGAQYAEIIEDFGISEYEISCFETVLESHDVIQVHYLIRIKADSADNTDLAGLFHVTSTWVYENDTWQLVFNMDQRVNDENI